VASRLVIRVHVISILTISIFVASRLMITLLAVSMLSMSPAMTSHLVRSILIMSIPVVSRVVTIILKIRRGVTRWLRLHLRTWQLLVGCIRGLPRP
jgi:hypothetical protein